ncbi:Eukaryotic translation initiation factor 2 subunit beta [Thalictrum thalictroides]|uniref:Eukaryotic translation initiation factor 2 subunit beta n=1 Tax=Thalictrum thalictroides TaxID=46969 RepID=A0A7J6VCN9_THATH|nr:Eukaryotic translation initiation factor 2 subunit beta [Thalictrum thalictroides]
MAEEAHAAVDRGVLESFQKPKRFLYKGLAPEAKINHIRSNQKKRRKKKPLTEKKLQPVMAEEAPAAVTVDGGVLQHPHCASRHRQPEHVMTFLLAELNTVGFLDEQQRLVVRGRFAPRNFEVILEGYVAAI